MRKTLGGRSLIFWIIIAVLFVEDIFFSGTSFTAWFYRKAVMLPGIVIGLSFHEFAHAFVSTKLGDPLPKYQGRVSLNPLDHIDAYGFICLMLAGFGWGKPVVIDSRYYKNRRVGELLVALAGVVMNFLIAAAAAMITRIAVRNLSYSTFFGGIILDVLISIVSINVVLMLFNLIPIPPLDGFNVITQIFNLQKYSWWETVYSKGQFILIILILFNGTGRIISPLHSFIVTHLLF